MRLAAVPVLILVHCQIAGHVNTALSATYHRGWRFGFYGVSFGAAAEPPPQPYGGGDNGDDS
jgi:hypothetical protein